MTTPITPWFLSWVDTTTLDGWQLKPGAPPKVRNAYAKFMRDISMDPKPAPPPKGDQMFTMTPAVIAILNEYREKFGRAIGTLDLVDMSEEVFIQRLRTAIDTGKKLDGRSRNFYVKMPPPGVVW